MGAERKLRRLSHAIGRPGFPPAFPLGFERETADLAAGAAPSESPLYAK